MMSQGSVCLCVGLAQMVNEADSTRQLFTNYWSPKRHPDSSSSANVLHSTVQRLPVLWLNQAEAMLSGRLRWWAACWAMLQGLCWWEVQTRACTYLDDQQGQQCPLDLQHIAAIKQTEHACSAPSGLVWASTCLVLSCRPTVSTSEAPREARNLLRGSLLLRWYCNASYADDNAAAFDGMQKTMWASALLPNEAKESVCRVPLATWSTHQEVQQDLQDPCHPGDLASPECQHRPLVLEGLEAQCHLAGWQPNATI